MKEKKSLTLAEINEILGVRPIARNDNSPLVPVYDLDYNLDVVKVNEKDAQAEINRHAQNLDVASIIERYVQTDNPIELNAKNGNAINKEIEIEEQQLDGSVKVKKINYADASWVAPNDTYISINEKLKKAQKTINQLSEEIAKVESIKQVSNDSNKVIASDSIKSVAENKQQTE